MPVNAKVHKMYKAMVREGMSKGKAAAIAQSKTGTALATGKPPKHPMSRGMKAKALARRMRG